VSGWEFILDQPDPGGLGVWLTYQLGKRLFGETVALLAAGLTATSLSSIKFRVIVEPSLGLVLTILFTLSWLDAFHNPGFSPRWLPLCSRSHIRSPGAHPPADRCLCCPAFAIPGWFYWCVQPGDTPQLILFGVTALAISLLLFVWAICGHRQPTLTLIPSGEL